MNQGLKKPFFALMFSMIGRGLSQQERLFIIHWLIPFLVKTRVATLFIFYSEDKWNSFDSVGPNCLLLQMLDLSVVLV